MLYFKHYSKMQKLYRSFYSEKYISCSDGFCTNNETKVLYFHFKIWINYSICFDKISFIEQSLRFKEIIIMKIYINFLESFIRKHDKSITEKVNVNFNQKSINLYVSHIRKINNINIFLLVINLKLYFNDKLNYIWFWNNNSESRSKFSK